MEQNDQWNQRVLEYANRVKDFIKGAGETSIPQLHLGLKLPTSSLFMGVGWLLKSGEILIQEKNGTIFFSLPPSPGPDVEKGSALAGAVERHPPPKDKTRKGSMKRA